MVSRGTSRVDPVAAAATILAGIMLVAYLWVIRAQSDQPVAWFVGMLILGAALGVYGASRSSRHRQVALLFAALVLVVAGMLAILSIGLPILLAGVLCGVAAARGPTGRRP